MLTSGQKSLRVSLNEPVVMFEHIVLYDGTRRLEQLGQLVRREAGVEPARTKYLDKQRAKGVKLVEAEHFVRIDCSNDGLEDFQLSAPLRCSALEDYVADEASPAPEVEIKLVGDVLCEEHLARVASN